VERARDPALLRREAAGAKARGRRHAAV